MKRICSLLLALVMVFGLFPTASAATGIGDYPALELETDLVITSSDDGYTYVTFTPETSGSYVFYNKDTGDTDAALYTADMVELAYSDDCWEDHGFHGSLSFCITYDLEAGQTYVLGAAFLSGKIADMTIRVDRNHSYEKTITKEPTCTEEGEATYTCTVCGYSYTEALPPEHRYEETIIKEPTCTEEGEAIYTCTICGDSYTGTVPSILMFEVYEDHVTVSGYNGTPTELIIPAEYEGLPVTAIDAWAFYDCDSLIRVDLPSSLTIIYTSAFSNCSSLANIELPASVTTIGNSAFSSCSSLTGIHVDENNMKYSSDARGVLFDKAKTHLIQAPGAIADNYTIPDGVTSIDELAFVSCSSLTGIDFPDTLTSIGSTAFRFCTGLTEIVIPEGVTTINRLAFGDCINLCNVDLPNSLTSIGEFAFSGCTSLSDIVIPESVKYIDEGAFYECINLIRVDLPSDLTTIGTSTFSYCYNLTTINLPDNITTIGNSVFEGCSALASIDLPGSITSIGDYAFSGCSSLTTIDLPDSITSIGDSAFNCCSSLTTIDLPDSITSIGDSAFFWCTALVSISLPDSITCIGDEAFRCSNLNSIYFNGNAPEFGENIFEMVTATAYYPAGNPTWTENVMQNYGGDITWVAYDPNAPVNPFTDVPAGCWYEAPVLWALENGVTSGTSDTSFSPGNQCLRAHVVTFLWNAEGTPAPKTTSSSFSDVPAGAWYEKPVLWAVENGITSGVSSTKFGAGDVCSRYQVVFFLWKAAGSPEPKTTVNPFTDVNPGHFFYKAVLWAVENGITSGTSATTFSPGASCNRAQVVTFLYAAYN